jgi:glycosyltransferase involved in cell wall biosynthesis
MLQQWGKQIEVMRKLIFLQNIVAPYRTDLFNYLNRIAPNYDLSIEVFYFRLTDSIRHWKIDLNAMTYRNVVHSGIYLNLKGYHFFLNLTLILRLLKNAHDEVVLGSSWNDFNILILCFLKKIKLLGNKLHIWSEANFMTKGMQKDNLIKSCIRRFVFSAVDGKVIIPGQIAKDTINNYWKINKEFVILPNLIDHNVFKPSHINQDYEKPTIIIAARLSEADKGIINFFKSVDREWLSKFKFYIAGSGPDKNMIEGYFKLSKIRNVELLGELSREELVKYYHKSDIFVLPSLSDPNPISVVEALHAGLVLFISKRCGNYKEAVIEGRNGFVFDPLNKDELRKRCKMLSECKNIMQMKRNSLDVANNRFNLEDCCNDFLNNI